MTNRYWDEDEKFNGEAIYQTREGRLRALNYIIRKYIEKTEGVKMNYNKNVPMSMSSIIKMIETDEKFKNFALDNYHVIIYCDRSEDNDDEPRIQVRKITDKMAELIQKNLK